MIHQLNINDFELITFYGYTSTIPGLDRIDEISNMNGMHSRSEERKFAHMEELYNELINKAVELSNTKDIITFGDNKSVFKLKSKKSDAIIYIGRYDGTYSIGVNVHQFFGREYDFKTKTWSEYKSENY